MIVVKGSEILSSHIISYNLNCLKGGYIGGHAEKNYRAH